MRGTLARGEPKTRSDRDTVRVGDLEVDRTPVTNSRYARFVAETGHRPPLFWTRGSPPPLLADHPVVGVDFFDAVAFALWAGGSLPTELEWVEASGLPEHRAYVWGDRFDVSRCNTVRSGVKGTTPVGRYPEGAAPSGCLDLCGNVWELTCSDDRRQPLAVLVKGGSWYDFPCHAKIDTAFNALVHKASSTVGFRLVYGRGLRLPPFLDRDLVARSIAWRRSDGDPAKNPPGPADGEFARVLEELRERAEARLADLAGAPALWPDTPAVVDALEALDPAPPPPPAPERDPVGVLAYAARMSARLGTAIERNPRLVGLSLLAAVGLVLVLLWSTARAEGALLRAPRSLPEPPAAAGEPNPRRTAGPVPEARSLDRVTEALAALRGTDGPVREEAERFLVAQADRAEAAAARALERARTEAERGSLRYVLASIEEERSPTTRPLLLRRPPSQGLVVYLRTVDEGSIRLVEVARRTAKAERTPFAVVYAGDRPIEEIADMYALELGSISLFGDAEGTFAERSALRDAGLAVAGLRADGSLAFVHRGAISRTVLADRVRGLR